ncbi:hypothetical protein ACIBQ6_34715 [Nonomuraea sp. NPDC049655]|uniref:hypothetical protein n=1 Tax=Nonomuraea sp. NPDC049655 TaxID=3364355 RepID=UPI00379A5915
MKHSMVATFVVVVAATSACTSDSLLAQKSPVVSTTLERQCSTQLCRWTVGTDPAILVQEGNGSQLMPLKARLEWIDGESCLVMVAKDERRTRTVIPMWPKSAVPIRAGGRRGVTLPGVGRFLDGDALKGGGTWILPNFTPSYRFAGPPPARCGKHDGYFMIDAMGLTHA